MRSVLLLAGRELRDTWRNRWFVMFTAVFAMVALALSWLSTTGVVGAGYAGFGRTAASLVNLVLLTVPLMGLMVGAAAVAGERERGSLVFLLAQPIEPWELVAGKFAGISLALVGSLLLGFGVAAGLLGARGAAGPPGPFVAFLGLSALLAMLAASAGLLISTLAARSGMAAGLAILLWLALILLGDLGLMATALTLRLGAAELLGLSLANPLVVFKTATLVMTRGGLESLGPAGLVATRALGDGLVPVLLGILTLWVAAPLAAAGALLQRRRGIG